MTDTTDRETAREHKEQGNWDAAIAGYDRACSQDPDNPALLFERGFVKLEKGDFAEAIEDFSKVLEKRPHDLNSLFNRGLCRLRLSRFAEAQEDYTEFLNQVPDDAEALAHRGHCLLELEQPENAIADFDHAVQSDAELVSVIFHRGRAFQSLKRWRLAVGDYDRVLQISSQYEDVFFNRAWCKGKLGDHQGAIQDYDRYLKVHPDDVESYLYRGNRYLDLGNYERAVENYEKATTLEHGAAQKYPSFSGEVEQLRQIEKSGSAEELAALFSKIGRYRLDTGENKTAVLWFNRAIDADKEYAEAWSGRGKARRGLEQNHGAILDCARSVDLNPGNSQAWCELGTVRQKLNLHEEAIADFSRAIDLNRGEAVAYLNRGYSKKAIGDQAGAGVDFQCAFELQPALAAEHPEASSVLDTQLEQPEQPPTKTIDPPQSEEIPESTSPYSAEFQPEPVATISPVASGDDESGEVKKKQRGLFGKIVSILLKTVAIGAMTAVVGVSLTKATDVIYTTTCLAGDGIALGHIPPHSQVCKTLYCMRTDTTGHHICGTSGRLSEMSLFFCPEHGRLSGLAFLDFSLLGTMLWWLYSFCVGLMVLVCYALGITLVGGLFVLPVSLLLSKQRRVRVLKGLITTSAALAVVPALISCFVYIWW